MSEKVKGVKTEAKQTNAQNDATKTSTRKAEGSTVDGGSKTQETSSNSERLQRKLILLNQHRRLRLVIFLVCQLRSIVLDGTRSSVNLKLRN